MEYDAYKDGELSDQELQILEQDRIDRRQNNQRKMAWVAVASMIVFTGLIFMPFVGKDSLDTFMGVADLFYIAQAGIVSAYTGAEAWVNKTRSSNNNARPSPRGPIT